MTAPNIVAKLSSLSGLNKLPASAIQGLPQTFVTRFIQLEDVLPSSYTSGENTDKVRALFVTGGNDGIEFDIINFTDAVDTPSSIEADKWVKSNTAGDALIFVDDPPGGGGTSPAVYLGEDQAISFQIPQFPANAQESNKKAIRLRATAVNTAVTHKITSFTGGGGFANILTNSSVSNVGRITVVQAGFVNVTIEDEVQIDTSTAGGAGNEGELILMLVQWVATGDHKRSWTVEHAIEDPITRAVKFPLTLTTGLIPVEAGDYFTLEFDFASSRVNDSILFQLPEDNLNLDERVEFIYFPLTRVVPTGPRGPPGPAGVGTTTELEPTDPLPSTTGKSLGDIINYKGELYELVAGTTDPHIYRGIIGDGPSGSPYLGDSTFEWDSSNIRVNLSKAVLGSSPPARIFIQFHSGRAYNETGLIRASGQDTATTYRYAHDPTEPDLPTTSPIKKGDPFDVSFYTTSALTTPFNIQANANRWEEDKRDRFTGVSVKEDGTAEGTLATVQSFNFTGEGVSVTRADRSDEVEVAITGGGGGDSRLIAQPAVPTDLSSYAQGQIIPLNAPVKGKWVEVKGADAGEKHSFRVDFEADATNTARASWAVGTDLNYGYSSFGDIFGNIYTADGGTPLTASETPVRRMEIEQEVATRVVNPGGRIDFSFNTTYTLLIRKTDLATAPATIYARYYTGPPSDDNQVTTVLFNKGADNSQHDYHTYIDSNGPDISEEDLLGIKYFNLFRSNPPTGDQTSNPLELHDNKSTEDFTLPPAPWAQAGQSAPTGTINFSGDEADTAKALKLVAEETTPPMSGGAPTAAPSDITFVKHASVNRWENFISPVYTTLGLRSVANENLVAILFYGGVYPQNISNQSTYNSVFLSSFIKQKTPITIEIDGTSYNLSFGSFFTRNSVNVNSFVSSTIPTNDRVSATDLTKAINFELVDNIVRNDLPSYVQSGNNQITIRATTVNDDYGLSYFSAGHSFNQTYILYVKRSKGRLTGNNSLILNGRPFNLTYSRRSGDFYAYSTQRITDINFIPSTAGNISLGYNVRFSDGTYLNNTRSHLFQTVPGATPETKAQKVLTLAGVIDWLRAGIITVTKTQVPQQFRTDATTNTTRFQPKCFEIGTASQITALTKVEDCIYMTEKASQ